MHVGCPACGTINRVPDERPSGEPVCGRCGAELMAAKPASLSVESRMNGSSAADMRSSWAGRS